MKNIFLVPTKEFSGLFYDKGNLYYNTALYQTPLLRENQYIYITLDEVPKLDEYGINTRNNIVFKDKGFSPDKEDKKYNKKIIVTNDPTLINYGVQSIPTDFLIFFAKKAFVSFVFVNVIEMLQTRHGVEWFDLPNQSEGREPDGIYRKIYKISFPDEKYLTLKKELSETQLQDPIDCEQESTMQKASMKYLSKCVADGNRLTGYADEDFREGYKYREQEEINLSQGYLTANLENIEKMKSMFDLKDVERIAEIFYYKGIKKASHPEVRFDFNDFMTTFKKNI